MALITTVFSTKGGCGKTTTTANPRGILASLGYEVLLIDADPQPTLSSYFPIKQAASRGITPLIRPESGIDISSCISETTTPGLFIVRSDDPNGDLITYTQQTVVARYRLKSILKQLTEFQFILIDSQGANTTLLQTAVIATDLRWVSFQCKWRVTFRCNLTQQMLCLLLSHQRWRQLPYQAQAWKTVCGT